MTTRIKTLSKTNEGKASWHDFCHKWGHGTFDPRRHPAHLLKAFLEGTQPGPKRPSADSSPRITGNLSGDITESHKIGHRETFHELPLQRRLDLALGMVTLNGTVSLGAIGGKLSLSKADLLECGLFNLTPTSGDPYQYEVSLHPAKPNS